MAKGFIIEELRVTGGTMRLRDSRTGKVVEVPLTVGGALTLPGEDEADAIDTEESATDDDEVTDADEGGADDAAEAAKRKRRRRRARARKAEAQREANVEEAPALAVPRSRAVTEDPTPVVDESTLSDDDKAAVEEFRARVSKATARGKRGGLGWQEITVDGRSGLQARWGKGQFKILHTGGDSHALFYEWDGGKWERIACGKADDLMRLAVARSEDEQPKAPLTTLTLEVARLFCGTPDQQEAASERLRPVRSPVQPEPEAHSHDKPRLSIRYSVAGETTSGPLVNVTLQLHVGASKTALFQRDAVQLHSPKSQPEDVLEALFQEVIDEDDPKLLRRLGRFLGPVLASEKFKELTERDENDTLAEDLVSALSEASVVFDDTSATKTPRKAKAEPPAEDAPRPPAGDTPSETEVMDKELMSSFASELENVLAEDD
jgi:hypothetical protein